MKQKLTAESVCKKFNTLRMENQNRVFPSEELDVLLKKNFNSNLAYQIKKELFTSSKKEGKKFFKFSSEPIYVKRMEKILDEYRKSLIKKPVKPISEEKCIAQLRAAGYQIQKPIGFDEVRFAKDHPDLYKQYMLYGEV